MTVSRRWAILTDRPPPLPRRERRRASRPSLRYSIRVGRIACPSTTRPSSSRPSTTCDTSDRPVISQERLVRQSFVAGSRVGVVGVAGEHGPVVEAGVAHATAGGQDERPQSARFAVVGCHRQGLVGQLQGRGSAAAVEQHAGLAHQGGDVVGLVREYRLPGGERLGRVAGARRQDADPVQGADVGRLVLERPLEGVERGAVRRQAASPPRPAGAACRRWPARSRGRAGNA